MSKTSIDFGAPFDVQIAQARAQGVMLSPAYYAMPAEKRAQAFTVSGLAKLDQVQRVADELAKAQLEGKTLHEFQTWAKDQDWQLPRHRLETIYRNAAQTAYQAGHWRDFEEHATSRPFLMYDAINDSRVRPSHLALDGIIKPVGDAFWQTHACPNGHRCRCAIRSLTRAQAMQKGGVTQNVPAEGRADEGWGHKPTDGFKGLLNSIENRLNKCRVNMAVTFAKARDNAPMWCKEGPARDLLLMQKAWAERGGAMPEPMSLVLPKMAFATEQDGYRKFMHSMELEESGGWFELPSGDRVFVNQDLFRTVDGKAWKMFKRGRDTWALYIAQSIKSPQEIWKIDLTMSQELYLLSRFQRGGEVIEALAVFKRFDKTGAWVAGKTAFVSDDKNERYLHRKRDEILASKCCAKWIQFE